MSRIPVIQEPVNAPIEKDVKKNNEFLMICNFFLKKVASMNPSYRSYAEYGKKELDFRQGKPLYLSKGSCYCTKYNQKIEENEENHFCPRCGQRYTT